MGPDGKWRTKEGYENYSGSKSFLTRNSSTYLQCKKKDVLIAQQPGLTAAFVVTQVAIPKPRKQPEQPVTYTLPPGDYVIGDLQTLAGLDLTPDDPDSTQGKYEHQGLPYVLGDTAYGDGMFKGSNGKVYGVDSGQLGVMDARMAERPEKIMFGSRHQFSEAFSVEIWQGVFKISGNGMHLEIDTR